jgi:hypothetical protein
VVAVISRRVPVRQFLNSEHVGTVVRVLEKLEALGKSVVRLSLIWLGIRLPGSAAPDPVRPHECENNLLGKALNTHQATHQAFRCFNPPDVH